VRPTTGASRTTRAVHIPPDEEEVARKRAEDERKRRAVTIWTVGGHVFEGHVAEEDAEGPLRDGLRAAPEPGATIDLHAGGTVTAIVAAHVVAVRFRAPRG
jgi:hypothetical protein